VVLAGAGGRLKRDGIIRHRSRTLVESELTVQDHIPVTTPQRTLEDLRRTTTPGELRRALREAEFLNLPVLPLLLVDDGAGNELELMLLKACRRAHLPIPETNVVVLGFEVDFLWREQRLVVETDGYQAHRGSVAFAEDRRRDALLVANGYTVLRFTHDQVKYERDSVVATIRNQLRRCALHPLQRR
jgi:very-short-patch-repair endonuclease